MPIVMWIEHKGSERIRVLNRNKGLVLYLHSLSLKFQTVKRNVHARIMALPVCPELTRTSLPRTADVNSFLSVTG